ncbi:MAG: sigma-70 family RNA polymerase sigma factor [Acidimicrobiaceae bacterium]|nr:sigma-70 family RNA polymerase sigma factor [Acidimicrobiaceae bacterium]
MTDRRRTVGGLTMLKPLSLEEERSLLPVITRGREAARRLEVGEMDVTTTRALRREREEGQRAESTLLRATCGLVRLRVTERGYRFGNDELEAAGVEGLVNALNRFDPEKGNRFSTYANYWIMKLVNQAIRQQAGLSETEMEHVLALQKLLRSDLAKKFSTKEIAATLGVSSAKARDIVQMNHDLINRRFETGDFDRGIEARPSLDANEAPHWVIEELQRLCGDDFDAFWQYAFRTMSIEEIAKTKGISRQAMSKRLEKWRKVVRESAEARRLQEWFDQQ